MYQRDPRLQQYDYFLGNVIENYKLNDMRARKKYTDFRLKTEIIMAIMNKKKKKY